MEFTDQSTYHAEAPRPYGPARREAAFQPQVGKVTDIHRLIGGGVHPFPLSLMSFSLVFQLSAAFYSPLVPKALDKSKFGFNVTVCPSKISGLFDDTGYEALPLPVDQIEDTKTTAARANITANAPDGVTDMALEAGEELRDDVIIPVRAVVNPLESGTVCVVKYLERSQLVEELVSVTVDAVSVIERLHFSTALPDLLPNSAYKLR